MKIPRPYSIYTVIVYVTDHQQPDDVFQFVSIITITSTIINVVQFRRQNDRLHGSVNECKIRTASDIRANQRPSSEKIAYSESIYSRRKLVISANNDYNRTIIE